MSDAGLSFETATSLACFCASFVISRGRTGREGEEGRTDEDGVAAAILDRIEARFPAISPVLSAVGSGTAVVLEEAILLLLVRMRATLRQDIRLGPGHWQEELVGSTEFRS